MRDRSGSRAGSPARGQIRGIATGSCRRTWPPRSARSRRGCRSPSSSSCTDASPVFSWASALSGRSARALSVLFADVAPDDSPGFPRRSRRCSRRHLRANRVSFCAISRTAEGQSIALVVPSGRLRSGLSSRSRRSGRSPVAATFRTRSLRDRIGLVAPDRTFRPPVACTSRPQFTAQRVHAVFFQPSRFRLAHPTSPSVVLRRSILLFG